MASLRTFAMIVAVAATSLLSSPAQAARLALVIGNDDYQHLPKLQKAVGDARAVRAAFERLGFTVTYVENAGLTAFVSAVSTFGARIAAGDIVALHYSGHGVSIDGRNYLIPVDMPQPDQETLVRYLAIDAGGLVDQLRDRGPELVFAILDACRDNPFVSAGRSIGSPRGLDRMYAESGQFVLFSAGPGELALDRLSDSDTSETSVFTRVLLKYLETPGQTLQDLAKATQGEVRRLAATAGHEQFPDYFDRTEGKPVLSEDEIEPETGAIATDYQAAAAVGTVEAWDLFLRAHAHEAGNFYVELAKAARDKLVAGVSSDAGEDAQADENAASTGTSAEEQAPDGEDEVAMLPPAASEEDSAADALSEAEDAATIDVPALVRDLQAELKRVGCYSGSVDGVWGPRSRRSLAEFARIASIDAPDEDPDSAPHGFDGILDQLRASTDRVCPLPPSNRNAASGEDSPRPRRQQNQSGASGGSSGGGASSCFEFNGTRFCE